MRFRNIILVGTSHISSSSIENVNRTLRDVEPDIVAVELDAGRRHALKNKTPRPKNLDVLRRVGMTGFIFFIIAEQLQKHLGKIVNISPGSEMVTALEYAEKRNLAVALIDRDITITLGRLSRQFKKREMMRILFDLLVSPFSKKIKLDLRKVPEENLIREVLDQTKKRYPSLYNVLVAERDAHMSKRLFKLSHDFPDAKIVCVIGAGHMHGVVDRLKKLEQANIRFK